MITPKQGQTSSKTAGGDLLSLMLWLNCWFHLCCRLQTASSAAVNDRDIKESRSEHAAVSSHSSLLKEADMKQRQLERGVRDRPAEHVQRGHQMVDRDDGRREGSRKPSESEMQHRQERKHSGSHHHHHHHHHQQHSSTKDDALRHNRHAGRSGILCEIL